MSIEVRALTEQDEAIWRELWTGYLEFYESRVAEAVYQSTFRRMLVEGEYEPNALIAWDEDRAVGLVHYMFHRHCWRIENVCYLQDLYADPSVRGQGIGRAVLEALIEQARSMNADAIWLETNSNLKAATHLYEKCGFRHLSENELWPTPYARCNLQMVLEL